MLLGQHERKPPKQLLRSIGAVIRTIIRYGFHCSSLLRDLPVYHRPLDVLIIGHRRVWLDDQSPFLPSRSSVDLNTYPHFSGSTATLTLRELKVLFPVIPTVEPARMVSILRNEPQIRFYTTVLRSLETTRYLSLSNRHYVPVHTYRYRSRQRR